MKRNFLIVLTFFLFTVFAGTAQVKIIFDTDFGGDADDLGALAMLHNLHNKGECELLGIASWSTEQYVIPAMDAVNRFYGNPRNSHGNPVERIHIFRTGITTNPLPMHCHIN
jgi:hypothetical protein